jgi:predicted membrane-bound dolichyl-phosphate-mannose-protein mannosyltransferase
MNRIPDSLEPGRIYRCGKCKTRLAVKYQSDASREFKSPVKQVDRVDTIQYTPLERLASRPPLRKSLLSWLKEGEYRIIFLVALLALILHLFVLPYATTPMYDELPYVEEARSIIQLGQQTHPEQLSLGKLLIASGIWTLGDNPWGWRIASAIFAVALIVLFWFVCRKLAGKTTAFFAVFLLTFESFIFNFSSLAMVEVFVFTFMLMSFLFYLKDRYVLSGISLALSGLCKITGLLGVVVILGHWLIKKRAKSPANMGLFMVSVVAALMLLMPLLDFAATREWLNPLSRLSFVVQFHEAKTWTSVQGDFLASESSPWQWVLNPAGFRWTSWGLLFKINPTVWIMIIPSMCYMVYEFVKNRTAFSLFIILWFASFYFFWMLLTLALGKVTYYYYFYPSLLAVCGAIGYALSELWRKSSKWRFIDYRWIRFALIAYMCVNVICFIAFSMVNPAFMAYSAAGHTS